MQRSYEGSKRFFRSIVVTYLLLWLLTLGVSVVDTGYEVSSSITNRSWVAFSALSIIELLLMTAAFVGLMIFANWGRILFYAYLVYYLMFLAVFGRGSGSAPVDALNDLQAIAAGCIVYAISFTAVGDRFIKR